MSHSILAPSSADVWFECAGSVLMSAMFPEAETDETREGTAAHWVAAAILREWKDAGTSAPIMHSQYLGQPDPAGTIITNAMLEGAEMYAREIAFVCDEYGWGYLHIEDMVAAPQVHEQSYGTCDAWAYFPQVIRLHIWDFKFGHLDVPAFENKQLLNYYAGISNELGGNFNEPEAVVVMQAVQPRCFTHNGPIKEWEVSATDLRGWVNQLNAAAHAALGPDPLTTSGKQCRYCPARHGCKSARDAAMAGVDYIHRVIPDVLTDDAVSYELATLTDASKAIAYRLDAIKEEAAGRLMAGKVIPGFRMEAGSGNRKWTQDAGAIVALGSLMGANLLKDPEAVTPAEAGKRLRAVIQPDGKKLTEKAAEAMLDTLVSRPSSGMKVVQDSGTEARRIFYQLNQR